MLTDRIESGAATVVHLAEYFGELKAAALARLETGQASQRGYFTPTEDEAVRRLLVSYWQSRNALMELVRNLRDDTTLPGTQRPAAFLVGYAAALMLVDAARFLRETFQNRPLVREKLNEPEPHFGIPAGTFDAVQKSLTSPRHAWHLYHAFQYFRGKQSELRQVADRESMRAVWDIIERTSGRLDVTLAQYAQARLAFRGGEAVEQLRTDVLGRSLYGIQKLVSSLAAHVYIRPGHRPALPPEVASELGELVRPGDVLITRKEFAATNYFLPGYWPHAALYLGDAAELERLGLDAHEHVRPRWRKLLEPAQGEPRRVLEAMADGVRIREFTSPLACDSLAILRPQLAQERISEALARGLFHEGKCYDFDFDFTRSDRLVCTEVVYRAYEGIGGVSFKLSRRAGRLVLSAADLLKMALAREHFEPVAVFAPRRAKGVLSGAPAETLLRSCLPSE